MEMGILLHLFSKQVLNLLFVRYHRRSYSSQLEFFMFRLVASPIKYCMSVFTPCLILMCRNSNILSAEQNTSNMSSIAVQLASGLRP